MEKIVGVCVRLTNGFRVKMADKQGFLTKEGGSIKTWKKRWCVLKRGSIYYSKNQVNFLLVPRFVLGVYSELLP